MADDPILKWASPRQREFFEAVQKDGTHAAAAAALGVTRSVISRSLRRLQSKASKAGYSHAGDVSDHVPPHHFEKGRSTYLSKDKAPDGIARWIKTDARKTALLEALREAVAEIGEDAKPLPAVERVAATSGADSMVVYPMGDPHIGLFSWSVETGHDFDLAIAERNLVAAVDMLVDLAPPTESALILNIGDYFHGDDSSNRTARAGHALDIDTRWRKIMTVGLSIMERCVRRALEKHVRVRVINIEGNHDDHSAVMLSIALEALFRDNPRVTIDMSGAPRKYIRFGRCLIGSAHGHNEKLTDLPLIMATERADDWGGTHFRHFFTGHRHHEVLKELRGCRVEILGTLAAKDAWAGSKGYFSMRDMQLVVFHKDRGEIFRHRVGIEQIETHVTTTE